MTSTKLIESKGTNVFFQVAIDLGDKENAINTAKLLKALARGHKVSLEQFEIDLARWVEDLKNIILNK